MCRKIEPKIIDKYEGMDCTVIGVTQAKNTKLWFLQT
jgi:hypothetical protein